MGTILVAASNGHTVYRFNSDTPGVSNCKGGLHFGMAASIGQCRNDTNGWNGRDRAARDDHAQ